MELMLDWEVLVDFRLEFVATPEVHQAFTKTVS
jgi:hypothetical protein